MNEDAERVLEILLDYLNAEEANVVNAKQQIARLVEVEINTHEQTFLLLKYQQSKGERLGDFEVCYKNENKVDEWQRAFNILKVNQANIKNSLSEGPWVYRYWLYEKNHDRFYRKKK